MTDASQTFDRHARDYDAPRRRLIPPFDAFYGAAVSALDVIGASPKRVLDLGAGTGLLAERVADAHRSTDVVLLDAAPEMLEQARRRLGDRVSYVEGDLTAPLPEGRWCAMVSALAIHHLDDDAKRDLFARVHDALSPGGVFVNAEQVAGPTAHLDEHYARWHERESKARGATQEEWDGALERMRHDRCASVESQLGWLREAGFADADCLFKDHRFAVMVARRPR
jgi:tRNA (cmo5U34)-methyltransferase